MIRRYWKQIVLWFLGILLVCALAIFLLMQKEVPEKITYGMSFNTPYVEELGLNMEETYTAILADLGVRHLRLAAHWSMVEKGRDEYDFSALDYQIEQAQMYGADVILGVGRRLPRWPECHVPGWARELSWEDQKEEIRTYMTAVVERYKNEPHIIYWQVENEPYLEVFANEHCGDLDEDFLREEIELVRSLDGSRPILVTDSGNLGTWRGAYSLGDVFGTSVYVYFWNHHLGQFRTILPPAFYRVKENLVALFYGKKPTILIELSAEPWLLEPVVDVPIETQFTRMDAEKFDAIITYAQETRYARQYLWGAEWWYWLKKNDHPEMWEKGVELFSK